MDRGRDLDESLDPASRQSWRFLPAQRPAHSSPADWSGVLVRRYDEPPEVDQFATAPSRDVLLVVQQSGSYHLESRRGGRWVGADYLPGAMGMTAPEVSSVLRWHPIPHQASRAAQTRRPGVAAASTVHVHLAAGVVLETARSLGVPWSPASHPDEVILRNPAVLSVARALSTASESSAHRLVGESLAQALAAQLLTAAYVPVSSRAPQPPPVRPLTQQQVSAVVDHLQARHGENVGLDECAALVHLSRSHFLRAFSAATGKTPHRYLVALRMDRAGQMLRVSDLTVYDIAISCGYSGTSHFAATFRAHKGLSPTAYRHKHR